MKAELEVKNTLLKAILCIACILYAMMLSPPVFQ